MDLLQAIVLGIVQGLTEFAPVSSSAHLVIVPWLFGWPEPGLLFDTVLHLGTLVAVIAVFWREIWVVVSDWLRSLVPGRNSTPYSKLGWLIILGTIPGAVIGYLLKDVFEQLFGQPTTVGGFLLGTSVLLVVGERVSRKKEKVEQVSALGSLLIGISQAVAIAPGISRSGATMSTGLLLGLGRAEAARFSFLLSVPIILGAAASQLKDVAKIAPTLSPTGFGVTAGPGQASAVLTLVIGFIAAAISGYLCINFLLSYLRRGSFHAFAAYCFVLGLSVIAIGSVGLR